ncbi:class I SAM-dependent methyltransferase [Salipaludibacillus keqinensis]|nr:class I SAM-dependent methyltransferase [Salipaludibacillus keqinensis]
MLSKYYDDIFSTKEKAVTCIQEEIPLHREARLLDLAAGTGNEALYLGAAGYDVTATDLNPVMVEAMKKKAKNQSVHVTVKSQDMTQLNQSNFNKMDGIYCIGNSFAHLQNLDEMLQVFEGAYQLLKPGGTFIIQIVNYDRIYAQKITALPIIKNKEKRLDFQRHYQLKGNDLLFQMRLTVEGDDGKKETYDNETTLFPLKRAQFETLAQESPFHSWNVYGDFSRNTFSNKSPALVGILTKA